MNKNQSTKQLFQGALLLTIAGLISKILSAGYRVPLQNLMGDFGFYIYQQVYPFLGIALILSLYGFPAAISKLVANQIEDNRELSLRSFYLPITSLMFIVNAILFLGLFLSSHYIAVWMGDEQLFTPLRMTAFIFLIIPFPALLRGVFQGLNNMKPTAFSQIVEQLVRVGIIITTAVLIARRGVDIYNIGTGAAIASIIGSISAFFVLLAIWLKKHPFSFKKYSFQWGTYTKLIIGYSVFISMNHMLLLFLQFSDAFTLVPNLINHGYTVEEAKHWKGVVDRGQPLIQLGTVLGSSLALALIPTVTKNKLKHNPEHFLSHIQSALKFSFYVSLGASVGLASIFPYVNTLLFENGQGNSSLRVLAFAIVFASLFITVATILQGLGYVRITASFVVIGLVIKWLLNNWLVPLMGIMGGVIASVLSVIVVYVLTIYQLKKIIPRTRVFSVNWGTVCLSLGSMVLFIYIMNRSALHFFELSTRIDYFIYVLFLSASGALIYLFLLIKFNGFTRNELKALPYGEVLCKLAKRRK